MLMTRVVEVKQKKNRSMAFAIKKRKSSARCYEEARSVSEDCFW